MAGIKISQLTPVEQITDEEKLSFVVVNDGNTAKVSLKKVKEKVADLLGVAPDTLENIINEVEAIESGVISRFNGLEDTIQENIENLTNSINAQKDALQGYITTQVDAAKTQITGNIQSQLDALAAGVERIQSIQNEIDTIKAALETLNVDDLTAFQNQLNQYTDEFNRATAIIESFNSTGFDQLTAAIGNIETTAKAATQNYIASDASFKDLLTQEITDTINENIGEITTQIINEASNTFNALSTEVRAKVSKEELNKAETETNDRINTSNDAQQNWLSREKTSELLELQKINNGSKTIYTLLENADSDDGITRVNEDELVEYTQIAFNNKSQSFCNLIISPDSDRPQWSAVKDSDWITLINGVGTNGGTLTICVSENNSESTRYGTITVTFHNPDNSQTDITKEIDITQSDSDIEEDISETKTDLFNRYNRSPSQNSSCCGFVVNPQSMSIVSKRDYLNIESETDVPLLVASFKIPRTIMAILSLSTWQSKYAIGLLPQYGNTNGPTNQILIRDKNNNVLFSYKVKERDPQQWPLYQESIEPFDNDFNTAFTGVIPAKATIDVIVELKNESVSSQILPLFVKEAPIAKLLAYDYTNANNWKIYAVFDTNEPGSMTHSYVPQYIDTEENTDSRYGVWKAIELSDSGVPSSDQIIDKANTIGGGHWILDQDLYPTERDESSSDEGNYIIYPADSEDNIGRIYYYFYQEDLEY